MDFGITILYPPPVPSEGDQHQEDGVPLYDLGTRNPPLDLDIIAVHGLNGKPFKTWTDPASQKLWLRDILPQDLPRARVMTFGYQAAPALQSSVADIRDHARELLACLMERRARKDEIKRPLMFVGHSLGGLVIEQALVLASQAELYKDIDQSALGVIFFGTPHKGSSHAKLARGLANFSNTIARMPEPVLLEFLMQGSSGQKTLDEEFKKLLERRAYDIVSFYETKTMSGFRTLIVDKKSGVLSLPGEIATVEIQIPVSDNHRGMCRFASNSDKTYMRFLERIKSILEKNKLVDVTNEHYLVPRSVNTHFTGRQDIRERLIDSLAPSRHLRNEVQRRFVLHGMGGAGKTQIALKCAEDCRNKFWGIFWIDATSNETAQEGFMAIARACKQGENVDLIKTWLSEKDDWLLIIDNADNEDLDISTFFPEGNRGSILVTSRLSDSQRHASSGFSYKVDKMHPEDAITLLLKCADVQDTQNAETRALAGDVVDVLGKLALAIVQAGAVLRQQLCSLKDFCEVYSQQKGDLLESGRPLPTDDYQHSVYTTWEISIRKIQDMPDTHAKLALELLQTFSFMHFEGIHEDFFKKARANLDLGYWESWEDFIRGILFVKFMPSGWDQLLMGRALVLLVGLSLIGLDANRRISIHPLVHEWARDRMTPEEHRKYWLIAVAALAMSTNRDNNTLQYKQRGLLFPHVDVCLRYHYDELFSDSPDLKGRLDAVFLFAVIYFENGQATKALNLSLQDQKCKEVMFAPGHRSRSTTTEMTARLLWILERNEEAIKMDIELIEELVNAGDDEGTVVMMNRLAISYGSSGMHTEAIEKCLETLSKFEATFGSENQIILITKLTMGTTYLAMGKPKDSLKIAEKILEVRMRQYADNHAALISVMRLVAQSHAALNIFTKARKAQEVYLLQLTEVDGPNHPKTIFALNKLAEYQNRFGKSMQGVTKRGLVCRLEVVERAEIAFGKTDLRTLGYLELLARDYYTGLSYAKAEQVQEQVVKRKVQALGKDHKSVVESREFLGQIRSVGKFHRTISLWAPGALRNMEFRHDGQTAQLIRKSKVIAAV